MSAFDMEKRSDESRMLFRNVCFLSDTHNQGMFARDVKERLWDKTWKVDVFH
jgi:hypothetical protein